MLTFILGFACAWLALAILAYISSEYGDQTILLFNGICSTILELPLLPFFGIVALIGIIYRKIKKRG